VFITIGYMVRPRVGSDALYAAASVSIHSEFDYGMSEHLMFCKSLY
jgi:hypothetical protein